MATHPIWKDYYATLGTSAAASSNFGVVDEGPTPVVTLYEGTAYTRPGETIPKARLNDIVAAHLKRGFTPIGETDTPYIETSYWWDAGGVDEDFVNFCADYSYDPAFDPDADDLNAPPSDILMPGQYVPCTLAAGGNASFVVYYTTQTGDFNADFNADFLVTATQNATEAVATGGKFGTAWLDLMDYPTATSVVVNGRTYRVGGGCNQFVLYYVNAYGGWDTFVVLGNTEERDEVTRHTADIVYNNANTYARGKDNYLNELAHRYTFHTRYMTETQSIKMHHLLNSPLVYLHDIVEGVIRPVVLTGTETQYQRGPRLFRYDIEAQLAQERIRR